MTSNAHPSSDLAAAAGARILARADALAAHSEDEDALTCTFLTPAHQAVADMLRGWMAEAGMAAAIDAVGNVVGRYESPDPAAKTLLIGSHYDTVRNGGKYDGRLGILAAIEAVDALDRAGTGLPFHVEVIGFSEEEGVRFGAPFLGSYAVAGKFDPALLDLKDDDEITVADAIRAAGHDPAAISALARDPATLAGYLEVHIEQGPALLAAKAPLGVVTAIAGAARHIVIVSGVAGHAGTVPMAMRRDAATAAAEIVLEVERRCTADPRVVGTVGRLQVPGGAVNVIPGRCELSLDIRSGDDGARDAAVNEVLAFTRAVADRRGVAVDIRPLSRTAAVPCAPRLQVALAAAIERAGLAVHHLPSGAGHDAMVFDGITDIGMLFVRCGNGGISHDPHETITAEDAGTATAVLLDTLTHLPATGPRGD